MLENLKSDLRFAGRMLRKSPVFTAVAVISLGSGAVTAIFSVMTPSCSGRSPAPPTALGSSVWS